MNFLKILLLLALTTFFLLGCGSSAPDSAAPPAQNTTAAANSVPMQTTPVDELAAAQTLYKTNCARCHKEDGTGGKTYIEDVVVNADNLTTEKMKKMSDAKYYDYIENGVPDEGMPAFKGRLTEEQIKSIVKYIRADLQKP